MLYARIKSLPVLLLLCLIFLNGTCLAADNGAALPVEFKLQRFQVAGADHPPGQIVVLWIIPRAPYSLYAHDSDGGLPLTVRTMSEGTGESLPVFYVPGVSKPDPFDPALLVKVHSGKTPVFVDLPSKNLGVELHLSLLLCSDTNCVPVRKEWTIKKIGDAEYSALPHAQDQRWWSEFQKLFMTAQPVHAREAVANAVRSDQNSDTDRRDTVQSGHMEGEIHMVDSWNLIPRYAYPGLEVSGLAMAILLGLCAGVVLNVMPCVLPVITLKLSAFAAAAGTADERERIRCFRQHNLFFSIGILSWFILFSIVLGGGNSMWGQLFQQPWLVVLMLGVVFILSLSLFGLYSLPVLQFGRVGKERKDGPGSVFVAGFFATILATPCSGPLLGGVLGYAYRQPPVISSAVFMSIGVGMAFPYLVLAFVPGMARHFPKPGPWLQVVEKIVSFLLLVTCGYLFLLLPVDWMFPVGVTMVLLVPVLGVWGRFRLGLRFSDSSNSPSAWQRWRTALAKGRGIQAADPFLAPRWKILCCEIFVIALAVFFVIRTEKTEQSVYWETFTAPAFEAALGKVPLLVDFTADWCPNCKVLEHGVLTRDNLDSWQKRYGLRLIRVDLSRENPAGQALLERLGSSSIPVVALFPAGADKNRPLVLRDLFGEMTLEEALKTIIP